MIIFLLVVIVVVLLYGAAKVRSSAIFAIASFLAIVAIAWFCAATGITPGMFFATLGLLIFVFVVLGLIAKHVQGRQEIAFKLQLDEELRIVKEQSKVRHDEMVETVRKKFPGINIDL